MIDTSYKQYTLDNGLIVALKKIRCKTILSTLRIWQGPIDEKSGETGLVHLLEHNISRGGKGTNTKETLNKLGVFGEFYGYTFIDRTVYSIGVMPRDLEIALEYMSTSAFNPALNPKLFEVEKNIILREIADSIAEKPHSPTTTFTKEYFGEEHIKLLKRIMDSQYETTIKNATIDSLKEVYRRGYAPNNSDIVIVGELPENIEDIVQKNFGGYQKKECIKTPVPNMDPKGIKIVHIQHPELYYPEDPKASSLKLTLGIPMTKYHEEDYFSAFALSQLIGNGFSSRILDTIRHENGLVYNLQSRYVTEQNSSRMEIIGKIPSGKHNEIIGMIFDEFNTLQTTLISPEEAEKFFRKREYNLTRGYNYPEHITNHIESNIEYNTTTDNDLERLKRVTPQSIMNAARKYLPRSQQEGNYVLLMRDPLKDIIDLDKEQPMEFIW